MAKDRQTTIYDIAKLAGVSHTTVSSALHNSGRVSPERAKQIRELAAKTNYQPKAAAQMLRAKRTGNIGLVVPMQPTEAAEHGTMGPVMAAFVRVCETEGLRYHMEFVPPGECVDAAVSFEPPRQFAGQLVDGAIVAGYVDSRLIDWLGEQDRYPWVRLEEDDRYCVRGASDHGIHQATQHLAAYGHRRIAYAMGPERYSTMQLGKTAFLKAADDFKLSINRDRWMPHFELTPYRQCMAEYAAWAREILSSPDRPTAIICHMMTIARAIIHVAAETGIRVPEQLSVIGVGTQGDALKGYPCLTSIEPDFFASLEHSMAMLRQVLNGLTPTETTRWVMPHLVERDTTTIAPHGE